MEHEIDFVIHDQTYGIKKNPENKKYMISDASRRHAILLSASKSTTSTHLEIFDNLAHDTAHIPRLGDVTEQRRWQTDQDHQEIRHGQINCKHR